MSTEIKPGQVWAWKPGSTSHKAGTEVRVTSVNEEADPGARDIWYEYPDGSQAPQWRTRDGFLADMVFVKDAAAGPLDPSKVKAGDTVTLERTKRNDRVDALVEEVPQPGVLLLEGWGAVFQIGTVDPAWTLTDHQPAPKPEWEPGTIGTAGTVRGLGYTGPVVRTEEHLVPWWTPSKVDGAHYHREDHVTDFVPDEPRPLPTREQIADALGKLSGLTTWTQGGGLTNRSCGMLVDAVEALLRGESR
jgi:hypothetical protein